MTTTPRIDRIEAGRNFAINGAMDFFQRGVGPTAIPSTEYVTGYYLADRYSCRNEVATAAANSLRSTDVPSVAQSGYDFNYSLEVDITTAKPVLISSDSARMKTTLEGYDAAQFIRVGFRAQFWVKTNKTGVYTLTGINSGGSRRYVTSYTVNAADTWELKTVDFPPELTGTWNKTNGEGLQLTWTHANGIGATAPTGDWLNPGTALAVGQVNLYDNTANYWRITGIMIIPGEFSSDITFPFVRAGKNIQEEFALCQRYYEKSYSAGTAPAQVWPAAAPNLNTITTSISGATHDAQFAAFRVSKRAAPTVVTYDTTGASGFLDRSINGAAVTNSNAFALNLQGENSFGIRITGATLGDRYYWAGHWTADAEL